MAGQQSEQLLLVMTMVMITMVIIIVAVVIIIISMVSEGDVNAFRVVVNEVAC